MTDPTARDLIQRLADALPIRNTTALEYARTVLERYEQ